MGKMGKRIMNIIAVVLIVTIVFLLFYMEWNRRSDNRKEEALQNLTEIETLLSKDLEKDYPKTPREVADYYSQITKALYSGAEDEEVDALAKKILELYDEEFLQNTSEEKYRKDLYSEIAAWNQAKRTITNYLFVKEDQENTKTIDGRDYATVFVSYTIQEKGKVSEVRQYLLRKNVDGRWKILGWDVLPKEKGTNE